MDFVFKKAEDCFANAENYEYRIEVQGLEFIKVLEPFAEWLRVNDKLRRPTFMARLENGTQLKGLLGKQVIKVGYVEAQAEEHKRAFEAWLQALKPQ